MEGWAELGHTQTSENKDSPKDKDHPKNEDHPKKEDDEEMHANTDISSDSSKIYPYSCNIIQILGRFNTNIWI